MSFLLLYAYVDITFLTDIAAGALHTSRWGVSFPWDCFCEACWLSAAFYQTSSIVRFFELYWWRVVIDGKPPHLVDSCCSQVPEGHRERMRLAEMSFFWHRVYDPRSKTCVHFCDAAPELIGTAEVPALPSTADGMAFLGCVCSEHY